MSGAPSFDGLLQDGVTCSVTHELMCCDFNSTGKLLAAGTTNGAIMVFQTDSGAPMYKLYSADVEHLPVTAVRFMRGGNADQRNILMAAYASGHVRHWYVSTGQCLSTVPEKRQTLAAAFSPDSQSYATSGSDNKIYIYDGSTHQMVTTLEPSMSVSVMDGHMSRVFALVYHPSDPQILVSAGWDDTVQFWDTRQPHSSRKISGPHVCGDAMDIEPSSLNLVTASWRYHDALQIWDFSTGKHLATLQPELKTKYYAACWLNSDTIVAGGTQQPKAVAVNTKADTVLGALTGLDHGVYSMKYSPDTERVAIAAGMKAYVASVANPHHFSKRSEP